MAPYLRKFWTALGSVRLGIVLMFALVLVLGAGFFTLEFGSSNPFRFLNDLGIVEWVQTHGKVHIRTTWWFFVLLVLLFLLALNTFVCTTIRVQTLVKSSFHRLVTGRFIVKLAPHIMHYAVIMILVGHLASYLFSHVVPNNPLIPGMSAPLPPTPYSIRLEALEVDYYSGNRLKVWRGRALDARAELHFVDPNGLVMQRSEVTLNRPARFKGYSVHLKDFNPRTEGAGMNRRPYVNLIVKKDPGLVTCFAGTALFVVGLGLYLVEWFPNRKKKEEDS